jgi:hypothetical protein
MYPFSLKGLAWTSSLWVHENTLDTSNILKCSILGFTTVKASSGVYVFQSLVKTLVLNIYRVMHASAHRIIERF